MATGGIVAGSSRSGISGVESAGPSISTARGRRSRMTRATWRAAVGEWCRTGRISTSLAENVLAGPVELRPETLSPRFDDRLEVLLQDRQVGRVLFRDRPDERREAIANAGVAAAEEGAHQGPVGHDGDQLRRAHYGRRRLHLR